MKKLLLLMLLFILPVYGLYNGRLNKIDTFNPVYGDIKIYCRSNLTNNLFSFENCYSVEDENYTHKCSSNETFDLILYVKPNVTTIMDIKVQYSINKSNLTDENYFRQHTYNDLIIENEIIKKHFSMPSLDSAYVLIPFLSIIFILMVVVIIFGFKYMLSEKIDNNDIKIETKNEDVDDEIDNILKGLE